VSIPKILFAVVSCFRKSYPPEAASPAHKSGANTNVEWQRKLWVSSASSRVDVRFFYGGAGGREPLGDEVFLDCDDDYYSLVQKVRAVIRWALWAGYVYVLKLDDDVYVDVDKTLRGFLPVDYRGSLREGQVYRYGTSKETSRYAAGPCYWLSRKAMEAIINSPQPDTPYEDRATGYVLAQAGIPLTESTELMSPLKKDCLTNPGQYAQFHCETQSWREKFLAKYETKA
jgi:Galactosyltransferase